MTDREIAIYSAKRNIVDSIWRSANLEGFSTTYPKTEAILENVPVNGVSRDEIIFMVNMKRAWEFLLDNLDYPNSMAMLREINKICGSGLYPGNGEVRKLDVAIGGTTWTPNIPDEAMLYDSINTLEKIDDIELKALKYFCFISRTQMFLDGNKRVAQLIANKVLISGGVGIFRLKVEDIPEFKKILVEFYETNNDNYIIEYMKANCIYRVVDMKYAKEAKKFTFDKNNKETVPEERVLLDKVNITLLSDVLNKIITLLESLNVFGEVKLYERDGIIYLVFKEKDSSSILRYRVDDEGISKNGKFNKISDRKLRYIIKDSVGVLEDRFAYSVKSISFDYVGVAFREGVMYPSKEEKGTTEIELY